MERLHSSCGLSGRGKGGRAFLAGSAVSRGHPRFSSRHVAHVASLWTSRAGVAQGMRGWAQGHDVVLAAALAQGADEVFAAVHRRVDAGGHPTQLGQTVGVAAPQAHKFAASDKRKGLFVGRSRIAAVDGLDQPAGICCEDTLQNGSPRPKRMSGNSSACEAIDKRKQILGVKAGGQMLKRAEHKKVTLGRRVFHAHNDAQPVCLHPFADTTGHSHGPVIRDAHAVQASTPGVLEDIRKEKMAAGREVAVHVNIEAHAIF